MTESEFLRVVVERVNALAEQIEQRDFYEQRLQEDLENAEILISELRVSAAESATRAVEAEERTADLEREIQRLQLEGSQYWDVLGNIRGSRVLRAAATLARLATLRFRRPLPVWQDPERLRVYIDRRVQASLRDADRPERHVAEAIWGLPVMGNKDRDLVRVGVASVPARAEGLLQVVDALYDQVDEIFIYLNGYPEAPPGLVKDSRIKLFTGPDLGDRGKFRFVDNFHGYYFSVDDDIAYPPFYVEHLIDGIERYGRRALVGWHGSIIKEPFVDYYSPKYRKVYSFRSTRRADTFVHILGTGCAAYHSDTISLTMADFPQPNMTDVFLARKAQHLGVPRVLLAHRKGWAEPLTFEDTSSIYSDSKDRTRSPGDVAAATNQRVEALCPWELHTVEPTFTRVDMRVAVVDEAADAAGRASLLRDMLVPYNVDIRSFPGDSAGLEAIKGFRPHVTLIYPGDPSRIEVGGADDLIEPCVRSDGVVLVDLSVDLREARSKVIIDLVESWRARHGDRIRLMTFSQATAAAAGLDRIEDLIVTIPLPLRVPTTLRATFNHSEGILLGEAASLSDESLSEPLEEWVRAIRQALPSIGLYVAGSDGETPNPELGLEVVPESVLSDRLTATRLMVCPTRYSPFDTLPIVAAAVGVPVIYRRAEHSLSEYLGLGGVEVCHPAELAEVLPLLYHDSAVWRGHSIAGLRRAQSLDRRVVSAELYLTLRKLIGIAPPADAEP